MKIGRSGSGSDDIDINALRADLSGERPAEHDRAGFGGDIHRGPGESGGLVGGVGGEINDFPVTAFQHLRQNRLGDVHRAAEIDIDIDVPQVLRHLDERTDAAGAAGAVDQYIYMVEFFEGFLDGSVNSGFIGNIDLQRQGLPAQGFYRRGGLLSAVAIDIGADDVAAFLRQL